MIVLKFGGTSMGDENTWRQVLDIIARYDNPIIVVSATARTTRQLLAAADAALNDLEKARTISKKIEERHHSLINKFLAEEDHPRKAQIQQACHHWIENCVANFNKKLERISECKALSPRVKDQVASTGELLSAYLFARCGSAYGLDTCWIDARKIIATDSDFGQANPDQTVINRNVEVLRQSSESGQIPVMGGFYGEDPEGNITTLGFEGSDYSASLIGAGLHAGAIEIWTDVSGIYTCDPNVVENARPIPALSFQEATELAYFGAKVLHPSTLKPASAEGIPVFVKNIFRPSDTGTKIHNQAAQNTKAKAITYLDDVTLLTMTSNGKLEGHEFLARVFKALDENHIPVNAVTTTEASVSVALQAGYDSGTLNESLADIAALTKRDQEGLISIVGCNFKHTKEITNAVFDVLQKNDLSLISYSRSKNNLNIALSKTGLIPAVCRIHDRLFGG